MATTATMTYTATDALHDISLDSEARLVGLRDYAIAEIAKHPENAVAIASAFQTKSEALLGPTLTPTSMALTDYAEAVQREVRAAANLAIIRLHMTAQSQYRAAETAASNQAAGLASAGEFMLAESAEMQATTQLSDGAQQTAEHAAAEAEVATVDAATARAFAALVQASGALGSSRPAPQATTPKEAGMFSTRPTAQNDATPAPTPCGPSKR